MSRKIHLSIDTFTDPTRIMVGCVPMTWSIESEHTPHDRLTVSLALKPYRELAQVIPDAVEEVYHKILDTLLENMFEKDLRELCGGFISNEDPIYDHLINRFTYKEGREKIYHAYFEEESMYDLKQRLTRLIYDDEC